MLYKRKVFAGIHIGSCGIRMKIIESNEEYEIKILDYLEHNILLGKDTYTLGKISFDTVDKICEILKGFKQLLYDYGINDYKAIATNAIREAENKDYIIDQIKLKTGFDIDVISNEEENLLIYKSLRNKLPNKNKFKKEGAFIVNIGLGNIQISGYGENGLAFIQNIKLGSLRMRGVLSSLESKTLNFTKILQEYITSNVDKLKDCWFEGIYENFIVFGREVDIITKLSKLDDGIKYVKRKDYEKLLMGILERSSRGIRNEHDLLKEKEYTLIPSILTLKILLNMAGSKRVFIPRTSLTDGIIVDWIDHYYKTKNKDDFVEDVVSLAKTIGKRYLYDEKHAEDVEKKSLQLFEQLKGLHGLGNRERLLLRLGAILHDTGKFINMQEHYKHSYHIIKASNLIGISSEELEIIANVARYHSKVVPQHRHKKFYVLGEKNRVIVGKLIAIIRIADGLDRSHKQKIKDMKITLKEKKVIINAFAIENTLLEEWTFDVKAEFFIEVFGVTPILKINRSEGRCI
ncbi:MAG: HD domain-containing protein [Marinisporobacter sp.]|jgi:exopolyphosphatase/guanosine-5'-triphosphate,3'-diphosphate pyrophosphatase|nr:HD domain-containing protein [Marinisporobacter sp.]